MNRFLFVLVFCCTAAFSSAQNCQNFNFPTAIADSCQYAPLLCGSYLDQYCGSNAGLTDDAFGLASGFMRISSCFEDMSLQIQVFDCNPGSSGLVFSIREEDCNPQPVPLALDTILANTTDTLSVSNITSLLPYVMAISGVQGSQCSFNIQVLSGIGTASPGPVTCDCSGGGIDGPNHICSGAPVTYTLQGLMCNFTFGLPIGGNGEYCPPETACPGSLDSMVIKWHIPSVMHFVGDSTGLEVTIALDSNYMGLDTIRLDSIWVSWHLVSYEPTDSLAFCECSAISCEGGSLSAFQISIGAEKEFFFCQLSCAEPVCIVDGVEYTSPGVYTYQIGCKITVVTITQKFEEPIVPTVSICEGDEAILTVINFDPSFIYSWDTGAGGPSIVVSPIVTTMYHVTAVHITGNCVYTTPALVVVEPFLAENVGQVGVITCLNPCFNYLGTNYCQPGQHTIQLGPCHTRTFSIGFDPSIPTVVQPSVTICEGQCVDFFGQQICTSQLAMHTEGCTTYTRQIIVEPRDTTYKGLVGWINCEQPCLNYEGTIYCTPGVYKKETECETTFFEIQFEKLVKNMGVVGVLTCKNPCVTFEGIEYCKAQEIEKFDSCYIYKYKVDTNFIKPAVGKPMLDCLPTNTHFTVSFNVTGNPPFQVGEQILSDSFYLSDPQPNGTAYAFIVKHDNGCEVIVNGVYDCAQFCASNPGQLAGEVVHGCAGQSNVSVVTVQPPDLSPGDVLVYHLSNASGAVVASNDSGIFAFDPATMYIDSTYFVSCVVGPPDINGLPNPTETCTDTSTQQPVVFHLLPALSITGDSAICELDPILLTASGAQIYQWNTGVFGPVLEIPAATPDQSGLYTVKGWSEYGCFAEDSSNVEVFPADSKNCCKPQIPNAFTPNGDGANDSFAPLISDCSPLVFAEMRIYSRWGELVYRSDKDQLRWDGTNAGGEPAGSDTYVFTFRYRLLGEDEKTEKGEITLLR